MPGTIDLAPLAAIVVILWILTVIFRVKSRWHLYPVFRRVLLTAVVMAVAAFCWNLVQTWR
jgi:type VI protein secretion system component VasK